MILGGASRQGRNCTFEFLLLILSVTVLASKASSQAPEQDLNSKIFVLLGIYHELVDIMNVKRSNEFEVPMSELDLSLHEISFGLSQGDLDKLKSINDTLGPKGNLVNYEEKITKCLEAYEILLGNFDEAKLQVPVKVEYLIFSGLKLSIISEHKDVDWAAIEELCEVAKRWWNELSPNFKLTFIRDAVDESLDGIDRALKIRNLPMLQFASLMHYRCMRIAKATWNYH